MLTMPWQPMPAPTSDPSGTSVPVLWGQPEQKNGVRCASAPSTSLNDSAAFGGASRSGPIRSRSTRRNGSTSESAVSAPVSGTSAWPAASLLPTTAGVGRCRTSAARTRVSSHSSLSSTTSTVAVPAASRRVRTLVERVERTELQHAHAEVVQRRARRARGCAAPPSPSRRCDRRRRCRATRRGGSTTIGLSPFSAM